MVIKVLDEPKPALAAVRNLPEPAAQKHTVDFTRDVAPLLDRSCAACHGGDKKKGSFSIASREGILKGGQSGDPAVHPGNSAASKLLRMITDQVEDLEMPPLSKRTKYPSLTRDEVALVKAWIDEGLRWDTARP